MSTTPTTAVATFGAGCYWGTEKFFRNDFESAHPGSILDVKVGFMHPDASTPRPAPTYREVCGGDTGFVEVAQVTFNPAKASYRDLVKFFFTFHDPTTSNRQGNDVGTQYASAIFTHSPSSSSSDPASAAGSETETQESVAKAVISELNAALQSSDPTKRPAFRHGRSFAGEFVTTAVIPAGPFYPAHEEHQLYLAKNPSGYCNHSIRFKW